jgi:uncharacterized protein (DUF2267 family)
MRPTTTAGLFQHSLQTTDRWLKEITAQLGWADQRKGYKALRVTFHALRDRLPVNEAAQLSAQLPLVLRGIFWEGWNPAADKPHHGTFAVELHAGFRHNPEVDPEDVARAVFAVMTKEISAGEMDDVRSIVPQDMRDLMPAPGSQRCHRHEAAEAGSISAAHWGA